MTLPEKPQYTLKELFDNLPISERELGRRANINKVTLYNIKNNKRKTYRSTINRLLSALSEVYARTLTWENVTGIEELESAEQATNHQEEQS